MGEVVLQQMPGKLVGGLKTLNQSQLQFAEPRRVGQLPVPIKHQQRSLLDIKAMQPDQVWGFRGD